MKTALRTLLHIAALVTLVGCASNRYAEYPPKVQQAMIRFESINLNMTREDVHRILGEPVALLLDGAEQWQVEETFQAGRPCGRYMAVGSIKFLPTGKIAKIHGPGVVCSPLPK